jgi:hypothetical protein
MYNSITSVELQGGATKLKGGIYLAIPVGNALKFFSFFIVSCYVGNCNSGGAFLTTHFATEKTTDVHESAGCPFKERLLFHILFSHTEKT